jgi:hypothetical protein
MSAVAWRHHITVGLLGGPTLAPPICSCMFHEQSGMRKQVSLYNLSTSIAVSSYSSLKQSANKLQRGKKVIYFLNL